MGDWLLVPGMIRVTQAYALLSSSARPDLCVVGGFAVLPMDTSKQTGVYASELNHIVNSLQLLTTYHKDIAQQMVFIKDQLREIDLTLQAIVAYND